MLVNKFFMLANDVFDRDLNPIQPRKPVVLLPVCLRHRYAATSRDDFS